MHRALCSGVIRETRVGRSVFGWTVKATVAQRRGAKLGLILAKFDRPAVTIWEGRGLGNFEGIIGMQECFEQRLW